MASGREGSGREGLGSALISAGSPWHPSRLSLPKRNQSDDCGCDDDRRQAPIELINRAHPVPFGRSARVSSSRIARSSAASWDIVWLEAVWHPLRDEASLCS